MKCSKCNVTIYDESFKKCPVCGAKIVRKVRTIYEEKTSLRDLLKSVFLMPLLVIIFFAIPLLTTYMIIYVLENNDENTNYFVIIYFLAVLALILLTILFIRALNNKK